MILPPFEQEKNKKSFEYVCLNCLNDKERSEKPHRTFHLQKDCDRCGIRGQSVTIL